MDEGDFPHERSIPKHWLEEEQERALQDSNKPGRAPVPRGWSPPAWLNVILLLIMVALISALAYLRDEKPPWDGDLAVVPVVEEGADNAPEPLPDWADLRSPGRMKTLLRTAMKMNLGGQGEKPAWEWDTPLLAKVLEDNSATLDNFSDLCDDDDDQWNPENPAWKKEDLGSDPAWFKVLTLKQAEVAYLMRREQEEAAMRVALTLVKIASRLEKLDAWPSFMHRALDMHKTGAQSLAILLQNTRLSELQLRRFQMEDFLQWEPSGKSLARSLNGFYQFEKKLIMGPQAGDVPLPPGYMPLRSGWLLFKPNGTLRLFAESFRELKDEAGLTQMARVNQIDSREHRHFSERRRGVSGPNASGEEYFLTRVQEYEEILNQHSFARARYNIVMTLFAMRRYILKQGRIPKTLEELVPDYMAATVKDPFNGEPLRYHAAQGVVYSVGSDLKDDGGHPTPFPLTDESEPTARTGIFSAKSAKP